MGSSKKKERDKKKRKRDRSSSRTRTKDRKDKHHRHHHRHKKHKRHKEERSPSISLSDLSDLETDFQVKKPVNEPVRFVPSPEPLVAPEPVYVVGGDLSPPHPPSFTNGAAPPEDAQGGKEFSMSVEETNKIREKLGLKPLQVAKEVKTYEDYVQDQEDNSQKTYQAGQEVHKPPENIRDKIQVEKLREKIAAQKEKRLLKEKMKKLKGLGEADDEDNLTEWVKKSRKMEKDRKDAEKRNKMLEELDAQFGVNDLVEEERSETKKRLYNSKDLFGLKVQHSVDRFSEGHTTILTLKDSNILDGDEDSLVNVNIEDTERVEANLKRKREKPDELEYEAPEVDEFGRIVQSSVLTKYDEEIEGERKKSFRLSHKREGFHDLDDPFARVGATIPMGGASAAAKSSLDKKSKMLKLHREVLSLDTPAHQLATEYLTQQESISFKKIKKKKKKKKLTADDLEPLDDGEVHLGSRNAITKMREERAMDWEGVSVKKDMDDSVKSSAMRIKTLRELMEEDDEVVPNEEKKPEEGQEAPEEESDTERDAIELQEALQRSRRAKQSRTVTSDAMTDALVSSSRSSKSLSNTKDMTLNLTDEFCRSLGDIPTYGLSGNRAEDEAILLGKLPQKASGEAWDTKGGAWEEVDIETTKVEIACERNVPILEEEPDTGKGVVNALKLAVKKGYLEKGSDKKPVNATLQHLRAVNYSIEDKSVEDDRRGGRGGDRYMGPTMDFREKDLYRPDVKLDYVDDDGRKLSAKEAFRYLSHKFHGKGSGKNKLEKRIKKSNEEQLMKHMSSSDTPLQTLEKQKEKQKKLGAAYLVLSGSRTQETLDVKK